MVAIGGSCGVVLLCMSGMFPSFELDDNMKK